MEKPRHGQQPPNPDAQLKVKPIFKKDSDAAKKAETRQIKSASAQINTDRMEQNNSANTANAQKRSKSRSRKNKNKSAATTTPHNGFQQTFTKNASVKQPQTPQPTAADFRKNAAKKVDFKSISNMAVQTPLAWNLRDYNKEKPKRPLSRSASVSNLQPRRIPFANYGWATKTKDLSLKPTHNALANKVYNI